ncbi:class I SAM-dependent methyltransferase [Streptomyces sp. RM72]|uniref:class I SAM-dependent methyltransferase n=1 Tax=Streptomyces sp. RM72 TaxID=1115510 RepID=UPI0027E36BE0|nr:class I SAM-dependent methyltransferase [Streptomyces sp. RM72]
MPERVSFSEDQLPRQRRVAEGFGADPARYDRTRPSYPEALFHRIVGARTGLDVLDVGCGTGIAARQFQAAGCTVLGVEPDPRMAGFARGRGLEVEESTFEDWKPAGRSFDAVVAGQTWHWLDPAVGAVRASQALRPGGRLAVFWNAEVPPPEVLRSFGEIYRRVVPDSLVARQWTASTLDGYSMLSAKAADGMRQAGVFDAAQEWRFHWEKSYTRDEWLDQMPTHGDLGQHSPDQVAQVQEGIGAVIDAMGGGFTMGYTTVAVNAALTPA